MAILDIDTKFQGGKWDRCFEDDWISFKKIERSFLPTLIVKLPPEIWP